MALLVQKYGGSSVADAAKILNVANRIVKTREAGHQVVVVVSAMGDTTDDLLALASQINEKPAMRELDVLLSTGEIVSSTLLTMALHKLGYEAISLTGAQACIKTDAVYNSARIKDIDPRRITRELEKGNIVIVAGFQGITDDMDVTTLGRGGSDTTAVALAAASRRENAASVLYGRRRYLHHRPPRHHRRRKLADISYDEMLEMVTYGFKAIHPAR
jgi:aspartate kinase